MIAVGYDAALTVSARGAEHMSSDAGKTVRDAYRAFRRKMDRDPHKRQVLAAAEAALRARSIRTERDLERLDGLVRDIDPRRHEDPSR